MVSESLIRRWRVLEMCVGLPSGSAELDQWLLKRRMKTRLIKK